MVSTKSVGIFWHRLVRYTAVKTRAGTVLND